MAGHLWKFIEVAETLDEAGLIWQPEIGDEVSQRDQKEKVSVLVDTHCMTPSELREIYLWLPTVEQLITQLEARQAILFHAGLELSEHTYCYKTIIQTSFGPIECKANTLRIALGKALADILLSKYKGKLH
ncbi:MAG: hypothetical protein D6780_03360 [Candidatus Dadabacteria bacterium]|nr:MAG: hypothetical protein D6780_03360 [Candidatus Dadabacteria bacterium]